MWIEGVDIRHQSHSTAYIFCYLLVQILLDIKFFQETSNSFWSSNFFPGVEKYKLAFLKYKTMLLSSFPHSLVIEGIPLDESLHLLDFLPGGKL